MPGPAQPPVHTDDGQVGAGSDAGDHVGGDALPLPVVLLAQGTELQAPTRQGVVLASAGLPYLGQTWGRERAARAEEKPPTLRAPKGGQHWASAHSTPLPLGNRAVPAVPPWCSPQPSTAPGHPRCCPLGTEWSQPCPHGALAAPESRGTFLQVMTGKGLPPRPLKDPEPRGTFL